MRRGLSLLLCLTLSASPIAAQLRDPFPEAVEYGQDELNERRPEYTRAELAPEYPREEALLYRRQDHYALTILAPRDDLPAGHYYTKAYPGLTWTARVAADGGHWPYTYEIRNAAAGMTIEAGPCASIALTCTAGTITWPNPTSNATPGVRVCDKDGDCTAWEDWTITVAATPFRWIDATNGNNSNDGILVADGGTGPIQSMSSMSAKDAGTSIWIFRAGTYTGGSGLTGTGDSSRYELEVSSGNAIMWRCYPGESCTYDFGYPSTDPAPSFKFFGDYAYFEGFTFRRDKIKALEWAPSTSNAVGIFRLLTFQEGGPGGEGLNAAFIGSTSNDYVFLAHSLIVQNSTLGAASHTTLKLYALSHFLGESLSLPTGNDGADVKSVIAQYTFRASHFVGCDPSCITGNQDEQTAQAGVQTQGEITHNLFQDCGIRGALHYADDFPRDTGEAFGPMFAWRNTFDNCHVLAEDVTSAEGNLTLTQNVLINSQAAVGSCPAKVECLNVTDFTKIVLTNNLTGVVADNIVDDSGNLQGTNLTDHGPNSATPKGHMLGDAGTPRSNRLRRGDDLSARRFLIDERMAA